MPTYHEVTTAVTVKDETDDLFGETVTRVEVDDEGGGPFVVVTQSADGCGKIMIDVDEWPAIRIAIDKMVLSAVALTKSEEI